jgi:hypothetical protein
MTAEKFKQAICQAYFTGVGDARRRIFQNQCLPGIEEFEEWYQQFLDLFHPDLDKDENDKGSSIDNPAL